MSDEPSTDITNCADEPIHLPGRIQEHGCLLAFGDDFDRVLFSSTNAGSMLFGRPDQEACLVGERFADLFSSETRHAIRNSFSRALALRAPGLIRQCTIGERRFDVIARAFRNRMILEFEPSNISDQVAAFDLVRALQSRIDDVPSVDALIEQVPILLRGLIGYDRIMIYKFQLDGSGQVIAETRRPDLDSFRHQFFPASDIPTQARELYKKNTIRVIGDATSAGIPVIAAPEVADELLDLSYAHLRSVSPIHLEYLNNMGVAASMSISIMVGGKLWGLVACHHYSARTLRAAERIAAEMFGHFLSLQIEVREQSEALAAANAARRELDNLLPGLLDVDDGIREVMTSRLPDLRRLIDSDGVGLWLDGHWTTHGVTAPEARIRALCDIAGARCPGDVWSSHALSQDYPELSELKSEASGVIAVPLSRDGNDYLIFFRREIIHTVEWGGDPTKPIVGSGPNGDRLTPRKSFEIWRQEVVGHAKPWTSADLAMADAIRSALLEVVVHHHEIKSAERESYDAHRKVLIDELNHRVKNLLSLIKSIISRGVDGAQSVSEYADELEGRVKALALAHDQIARSGQGRLQLLFDAELAPYSDLRGNRVEINGPDNAALSPRAFATLALVVHELATNAAKYGALSSEEGILRVSWSLSPSGGYAVDWVEQCATSVKRPGAHGFGMSLIERAIPFDLNGRADIAFLETGMRAKFFIPAAHVRDMHDSTSRPPKRTTPSQVRPADLSFRTVLLLEDEFLVALDAETMISAGSRARVKLASDCEEALKGLEEADVEAAILDVSLEAETSIAVADKLREMGVPFVFATGYSDSAMIPERYQSVPVVRKPYEAESLFDALRMIDRRAG
jgi:light-regulated signal transduction histidine kinase (bacteriophytochrome)